MRRKRTIYFNDARHFHLFVFEPPMSLTDAWRPVDEVAGTGVDTLVYGIARADGLFYPTRVGKQFWSHVSEFDNAIYWKVLRNMRSLEERGVDLLQALAERAHDKGMEFFASFRMGTYEGVGSPEADPASGGRGLLDDGARENQLRVFDEVVSKYDVDGVELDFAASPGGMPPVLLADEASAGAGVLTEHVRRISAMTRAAGKQVGLRTPCIEKVADDQGFQVRQWLDEGLIDYVTPMMYSNLKLDGQMPIDWIIEAAHGADVSVYAMLQPFVEDGYPGHQYDEHYTAEMMRAAVTNFLARGADGVYAWFLDWPLGPGERDMLREMANPELMAGADKRYRLPRRDAVASALGYDAALPLEIPQADPGRRRGIPIYIGEDIKRAEHPPRSVTLRLRVRNAVSSDRMSFWLNGKSIAGGVRRRESGAYVRIPVSPHRVEHYSALWLELDLTDNPPMRGNNLVELSLDSRPAMLGGGIVVDDLEISHEYGLLR